MNAATLVNLALSLLGLAAPLDDPSDPGDPNDPGRGNNPIGG